MKKTKQDCIKQTAVCIHCVKEKCQHMAGSRNQDVHVLCKQLHPWKKVPPIGPSPAFPGTTLWCLAHLSRVAQVCTANQSASGCASSKLQARNQTRDAALPPVVQGLGSPYILAPGASRVLC